MSFDLILRGGTVVLPDTNGVPADIAIKGERIAAILSPGADAEARDTLDVSGRTVLPGVIDVHLHLGHGKDIARPRVPEDAATETATSGSAARRSSRHCAARSGVRPQIQISATGSTAACIRACNRA